MPVILGVLRIPRNPSRIPRESEGMWGLGPEFMAIIVQERPRETGVRTLSIEPGTTWQNGFVESFHGRFRDERLHREQFHTLTEVRAVIGDYREDENRLRPHSRLGYLSPAVYAQASCPSSVPVGIHPTPPGMDKPTQNYNHHQSLSLSYPLD